VNQYVKYTAIAMQMIAVILVFVFIGQKVDEYQKPEKPYYTILLSILGVFAALYLALKDFIKDSK
jgi:F0F1-type ATP synthase assembly protein I